MEQCDSSTTDKFRLTQFKGLRNIRLKQFFKKIKIEIVTFLTKRQIFPYEKQCPIKRR